MNSIPHNLGFALLHPGLALVGLGAVALPVMIHLWRRHRPDRVSWAAMRFLEQAYRRTARRTRLERLALLIVRAAAVAAVALALGRPHLDGGLPGRAGRHDLLLIDNSMSMNRRPSSQASALEVARRRAIERIRSARSDDRITVMTLAAPARVVADVSGRDLNRAIEAVGAIRATSRSGDLARGMQSAKQTAADGAFPADRRHVILLTDRSAHGWPLTVSTPDLTRITVATVHARATANLAITGLETLDHIVTPAWTTRFRLTLRNGTDQPHDGLAVDLYVDRRRARRLSIPALPAGTNRTLGFHHTFARAGQHRVEARLAETDDVLPDDDRRSLVVTVADAITVLIVTDATGADRAADGPRFIEAALAPRERKTSPAVDADVSEAEPARTGPFAPKTILSRELAGTSLDDTPWIILQDVARLDPEQWQRLYRFVADGGGLLIFAGDRLDVADYNEHTLDDGRGPVPVRLAVRPTTGANLASYETTPDRATPGLDGSFRDDTSFVRPAHAPTIHPALEELAAHPHRGFYRARVYRYAAIKPASLGDATVLLRYDDGGPALIERAIGTGKVLFCTTSADMTWTNLPARGDFVSFLLNLGTYLARDDNGRRNVTAAEEIRLTLEPNEVASRQAVSLAADDGTHAKMRVESVENDPAGKARLEASDDTAARAGFYEVRIAGEPARTELFAKQPPARESDLSPLPVDVLRQQLGPTGEVVDVTDQPLLGPRYGTVRDVGLDLLVLAGMLLLIETWLASHAGRPRSAPGRA